MEARTPTCRQILDMAAHGMLPDHALHLRLADTRVTVRSNSAQLLQELGGHYREFSGQGGAADILVTVVETGPLSPDLPFAPWTGEDDAAKEEFADLPDGRIVRKRRTGLLLVFGPAGHFVLGPCRRHLDQVVNAINARFADRQFRAGAALFHAAAVCLGEAAVAVAGFAGAGKSTLALEIMRHGASFVSNDRLLVGPVPGFGRDGLMVTGIPRMPRVNPGTLLHNDRLCMLLSEEERAAYARLSPRALWELERKYDIPIHDYFGPGRFRLRAGLAALVVLCWRPGDGAARAAWTDIASRPDLLPAFMKDRGVMFEEGPRRAEPSDYLALLGRCPVLVLDGGVDFGHAADVCLDVLRTSSPKTSSERA
jgi:HprK-related kinase B